MDGSTPELIPVRPEEELDLNRLGDYLRSRLPGTEGRLEVRQFAGGHANLTYLLDFAGTHYVLRRPPLGPVAPSSHDMSREHRVLSKLWRAFPLAPQSFLLCEDPTVVGAPFFVMERRHGVVVRGQVPPEFGAGLDPAANRRLSEVVVDTLADLHAVDPAAASLENLGHPDGFLRRQVEGWADRWRRSRVEENPVADELATWLLAHLPPSPPATLVHNDWRLDNMAVAGDDPGRCTAVYDWDMCTRGDPMADLGTLLSVWYDHDEIPSTLNPMPTHTPGFMSRAEGVERYAATSGRDVSGVGYYQVFGTFKMAVVLQQIYVRWHRGQTHDDRFAEMGAGAERLFELALRRRDEV